MDKSKLDEREYNRDVWTHGGGDHVGASLDSMKNGMRALFQT